MKIGVLGGMFDPIHLGHLRAAEVVREALELTQVLFVPSAVPPHRAQPSAGALERYAMVALGTAGHAPFLPSDLELRREGPSYTVDTVAALRETHAGAEIVLIVGSDNLPLIAQWREPAEVMRLARLAVLRRPGHDEAGLPADARALLTEAERIGRGAEWLATRMVDISSTEVRSRARAGLPLRGFVTEAVAGYIAAQRLYR